MDASSRRSTWLRSAREATAIHLEPHDRLGTGAAKRSRGPAPNTSPAFCATERLPSKPAVTIPPGSGISMTRLIVWTLFLAAVAGTRPRAPQRGGAGNAAAQGAGSCPPGTPHWLPRKQQPERDETRAEAPPT